MQQGAQSCAHWLTWRIGLDAGTAREKVRVARALGALPKIDQAFAIGQLSYAKVRAVTRIATAANEERVLEIALAATGAQLERVCRGFRTATADDKERAADRRIRARILGDGLVKLELVMTADEAELVVQAIERAREEMSGPAAGARHTVPAAGASSGVPGTAPRPTAADGLVHLVSAYLAEDHKNDAKDGEGASCAPSERHQLVIHLDRELTSGDATMSASLEDGTRVSAETLRRVACDGGLVAAAVDEQSAVLDVGRRTRAIPTAIRRALWIRDRGCRFPGCVNRRFIHGHHIQHWLHGGRTSLDNLVLLCSFHHRLVHEGGFVLAVREGTEVTVHAPDGTRLPAVPVLAPDPGAVEWVDDGWSSDSTSTPVPFPAWDGEPVDYDATLGVLLAA